MPYLFAESRHDRTEFASGQVFYSMPGHTAYPVRLASEIFGRCLAARKRHGLDEPCALYDPCCGTGYLLTTLAFLHGEAIQSVTGSEVDESALQVARRNLSLLTAAGLDARIAEIEAMIERFGKVAHENSLQSALKLREYAPQSYSPHLFRADATNGAEIAAGVEGRRMDVVITDVPYGVLTSWQTSETSEAPPIWRLLDALLPVLNPNAVVAISADKAQKAEHEKYARADKFQIGKRRITLLTPR